MIFYKSKDLLPGNKIELHNQAYIILSVSFTNPGKGQAFNTLKLQTIVLFKLDFLSIS